MRSGILSRDMRSLSVRKQKWLTARFTKLVASSSYYGMLSMCVFAGPGPAMGWLGLGRALADRRINPGIPWYRWKAGWEFCFRFWMLNFIAPALMIQKALPSQLVDMLTLPASILVS